MTCGIVYCLSRADCEKVAAEFQARLPKPYKPSPHYKP